MNYKLILFLLFSGLWVPLNAQNSKSATYNERITDYATELNLSDSQINVLKTIKADYKQKMKVIRDSKNPDKDFLKKLRLERKTALEGVLKPEQFTKWKEIVAQKKSDLNTNELRAEIKKYRKEQTQPVLLEKRKLFELELSTAEKLNIANQRAKRQAFRQSLKNGDLTKNESSKLRANQLKLEAKICLQPIVVNHQVALQNIEQELEPFHQKWEEDITAIKAKYQKQKHLSKHKFGNKKEARIYNFLLMPVE